MKLYLNRDQAKKMLGGVKFELYARTELTQEETDLVTNLRVQSSFNALIFLLLIHYCISCLRTKIQM